MHAKQKCSKSAEYAQNLNQGAGFEFNHPYAINRAYEINNWLHQYLNQEICLLFLKVKNRN